MLFEWFDTAEADAFATSLANEFMQRIPVETLAGEARGAQARLRDASTALLTRAGNFAKGRRLNIFKRARLANSLKWALHSAGYDKALVDDLTLEVAKRVSTTKYAGQPGGGSKAR